MRAVMAGQAPPHRVKMKSATQTCPRKIARAERAADRSDRRKCGSR